MGDESQIRATVSIGDSGYFFREGTSDGAKSAVYFGPTHCSDGIHRHITAVFDVESEDLNDVHLTGVKGKERWKKWSLQPNQIRSDITKWIRDNSILVDKPSIKGMDSDYYCVSAWRVYAGYRLLEGFISAIFWVISKPLAAMGIMTLVVDEDRERKRLKVAGRIDTNHMVDLLRKFRPFKGAIEAILPTIVLKMMPRVARLSLTHVSKMSDGDACLLIPKREGMRPAVMLKAEQYFQLDAAKGFEKATSLYERMELVEFLPDSAKLTSIGSVPFAFEAKGDWKEKGCSTSLISLSS